MVKHQNRLHREAVEDPMLETNIQGHIGRVSEQPGLVADVPAHCRGVGLDDL